MIFSLKKENILAIALITMIIFTTIKMTKESEYYNLKCIISKVDGNTYCVRDRRQMERSADILAKTTGKMQALVDHCYKEYPTRGNISRLKEKFNPTKIQETLPNSEYTAYSENKGEKIAFCLDKQKNSGGLIDQNTLTFVAIHELAHVASLSTQHDDEFWSNFKFLLIEAQKIKIYTPRDYKNNTQEYCGMDIVDNPYYDYNT
jgi:hypothetical protein